MNVNVDSQVPASIDTVEKLMAWGGILLHRANQQLQVLESPNFTNYACQASIFTADDGTERLVVRLCLKLEPDYSTGTTKLWEKVQEFSEVDIPSAYLS